MLLLATLDTLGIKLFKGANACVEACGDGGNDDNVGLIVGHVKCCLSLDEATTAAEGKLLDIWLAFDMIGNLDILGTSDIKDVLLTFSTKSRKSTNKQYTQAIPPPPLCTPSKLLMMMMLMSAQDA